MAGEPAISGSTAPGWLADSECTFEEALLAGVEAAEETVNALPTLPRRDASRYLPATVSDALSLVHARDEAKKKNAGNKVAKAKAKSGSAALFGPDDRILGAAQGSGDPGAFWLYVEDFFRDATQEDVHDILPLLKAPRSDPAFAMGPPGSGADVPPPSKKAATPPPPPPPPPPAGLAVTDDLTPVGDSLLGLLERRSSRLVSKLSRGGSEAVHRFAQGDDDSTLMDTEDEGTGGGKASGVVTQARAMTVPVTAQGAPAATLWDIMPTDRLGMLVLHLSELIEAVGVDGEEHALSEEERVAVMAAVRGARALSQSETSLLIGWLENRAGALSRSMHCTMEIDLLGLRRAREGAAEGATQQAVALDGAPSTSAAARSAAAAVEPMPTTISLPYGGQMHPYTQMVLQSKVPEHVHQAAIEAFGMDPVVHSGRTPAGELLGPEGQTRAGVATPAGGLEAGMASAAGGATPAVTAPTSMATEGGREHNIGDEDATGGGGGDEGMDMGGDGLDLDGDLTSRPGSGGGGGGRSSARQRGVSNYALLAGRKDPAKTAAAAAARKLTREANAAAAAQAAAAHPVFQAVANVISAGAADEDQKAVGISQWDLATSDPFLLAAAPQDEIAAETVALQAELAAVSAANRVSLAAALKGLLEDVQNQRNGAAMRAAEEAEVIAYYRRLREEKKKELKQRREAAHREAIAAAGAHKGMHSPRPVLGHHLLDEADAAGNGIVPAPFLGPDDMYDVLAQRGEDDEAFCAVCGEGHSHEPNVIVFCDRCDVAVHQICYDVYEVPESEWLCWPCREYEEAQRAAGVPQAEIRPPHALPDERRRLPGGSRDVKCALCPIRCGAFRRTTNGQQWVHQACAMWQPEPYLIPGAGPNVVADINKIPNKRWTTACDICGKVDGAVINCKHPGTCQYNFHVMCARNCGLYLTVRADIQGKPQYRIYCAIHSRGQKEKDARAAAARAEDEIRAATVAHTKAAQAQIRDAAIAALDAQEGELAHLRSVRVNMESCRVLADQCKRREKLKRQLAAARPALHAERLQNPTAAVQFLDKLHEMEEQGLTLGQQLEALPALAAAAAAVGPLPLTAAATPGAMALGTAEGGDTSGGGRRSMRNASKRQREAEVQGTTLVSPPAPLVIVPTAPPPPPQLPSKTPTPAVSVGNTVDGGGPSKRPRRGQPIVEPAAVEPVPAPSAATTTATAPPPPPPQSVPKPTRSGAAAAPAIERQRLMSSSEAKDINSKLPPKFKYVPVDQLHHQVKSEEQGTTGSSARAARAAAREAALAAGHTPTSPSPSPSEAAPSAGHTFAEGRQTRSRDAQRH